MIPTPANLPTGVTADSAIQTGVELILQIAGALAVIYIIVGAVKFSTSGGDPQRIASARSTILYSVIGLIVAIAAFAITSIVAEEAGSAAGSSDPIFGPGGIVTVITQWLSFVVGVASVIGIIYGGIRYITSGGNPQAAQAARSAIVYSIVGIIVAVLAQALATLVFEQISA